MPFTPISWPTDSTVTLCRVPWDGNYRDVVRFPSEAARTAYFDALASDSVKLEKAMYLKPGEPITVPTPYSRAYTYNYAVVENPALPVPGEVTPPVLYYFITGVAYVAPNTTALTVELDVWQTYIMGVHFGRCFLERGHWCAAQAYRYSLAWAGNEIVGFTPGNLGAYATVAESLDQGNEYRVAKQTWHDFENGDDSPWLVIFASTTDLSADWGTMDAPSLATSTGGDFDGLVGGIDYWAVDGSNAPRLFQQLKNAPWVSKGILSVTLFPKSAFYNFEIDGSTTIGNIPARRMSGLVDASAMSFFKETPMDDIMGALPERYSWLVKFATFPYSVIELTGYEGNSTLYKPEMFMLQNVWFNMASTFAAPFTRIAVFPAQYGQTTVSEISQTTAYHDSANRQRTRTTTRGTNMDNALVFADFPQFALTNDSYINYMATTRNTRTYQYSAAGWGRTRANEYAQLGYSNTMQSLSTADQNKTLQNIQDVATAAMSTAAAIGSGNYVGAAVGGAGAVVNLIGGNMQFQNNQALQSNIASSNLEMAQYAAQGDFENAIRGIESAVQDAALLAPSVVGQQGGNGFNVANGLFGVEYRVKVPDEAHIRAIGEYWLRYGYAHHAFMQPPQDLRAMTNATYWKVKECYIDNAQCDEGSKQVIRGIMEKGVTVYNDPADIGTLDFADNVPL